METPRPPSLIQPLGFRQRGRFIDEGREQGRTDQAARSVDARVPSQAASEINNTSRTSKIGTLLPNKVEGEYIQRSVLNSKSQQGRGIEHPTQRFHLRETGKDTLSSLPGNGMVVDPFTHGHAPVQMHIPQNEIVKVSMTITSQRMAGSNDLSSMTL